MNGKLFDNKGDFSDKVRFFISLIQGTLAQGSIVLYPYTRHPCARVDFFVPLYKATLRKGRFFCTLVQWSLAQGWIFLYPYRRVPYARMYFFVPLYKAPLRKGPFFCTLMQGTLAQRSIFLHPCSNFFASLHKGARDHCARVQKNRPLRKAPLCNGRFF